MYLLLLEPLLHRFQLRHEQLLFVASLQVLRPRQFVEGVSRKRLHDAWKKALTTAVDAAADDDAAAVAVVVDDTVAAAAASNGSLAERRR